MATVNKPTDPKQKEADINRKLQFYGIINAFQLGKVPSNEQIDVALNSFISSRALSNPSKRLSAEGRELVADFVDVVKHAQKLLLSKNEGNLLQDFIWQTHQFDATSISTPNSPLTKDEAKQHGDKALEGMRTLGTLLITNGQFRKLLSDASILIRDMAGDAATNAATKVRPSEDRLNQMDLPADDNTWHEAPNLSKENVRSQLQSVYKSSPVADARDTANKTFEGARQPDGSLDPQAGVQTGTGAVSEKIDANTSEDDRQAAKNTAAEYRRRAREYLDRKVPQERREQTIWRLKKMVIECQQHPDYQQAITTLLDLAERYGKHGRSVTTGGAGTVKQTRSAFAAAEADLKTLIERFANGTSTDDLWSSINTLYEDADKDPDLRNWFKSMDTYIRKCLQQQGYILDDDCNRQWHHLYDRGNFLLRERYRSHTDRIVDEVKFLADQFDQDPQNKAFSASLQKLFGDLGHDENGKPQFKPHLIKDLTEVIIPAAFENVAYIPIPRIEYSDPQIDAIVENLVLESDNFMPNVLEVASDNFFRWGRKKIASKRQNSIDVKVSGVQMDLRDVSFYVKRKKGFPSITDQGVANLFMGGEGFSFHMKLSSADPKDRQHFFKVEKVDVDVKHLNVKLVKSNHKLLFSLFKPVMLKVLRPVVQKTAEKQIKDQFNQLDQTLYLIKQEADRALEEARADPQNAPTIYSRYLNAAQKQMLLNKQKAEQAAAKMADKKVNVAITKEDSAFPSVHLPGGISSKATEFRELARKGEKWESPVFSIGSSGKSTDIPVAPQVARKPHAMKSTAPAGTGTGVTHGGYTNGHANGGATNGGITDGNLAKPVTATPNANTLSV
ncbi:DNA ligase (ATP) [Xylaria longipes]|nr:DNA ligase (ATP) [Xylaria longipes]